MTLRRKTLYISTLTMLILAGGFYGVAALIQAQGIAQIERSQIRGGVARVRQALVREAHDVQSIMRNYAGFGDPLGLGIVANRQYLNYTFSDEVLDNLKVGLVLLLNAEGEIVFAKQPLAPATMHTSDPALNTFAKTVFAQRNAMPNPSGYFLLPGQLLLFATLPVQPLDSAQAQHSTLIFARPINDEVLQRLNQTTQLILQLQRIDTPLPQDFSAARRALDGAKENLVTVNSSDEIATSYSLLTDSTDTPIAILRMEAARTSHELAMGSTRYLLWALLLAGLTLALTNVGIVDRLVLARMTTLSRDVDRIAQNHEFDSRLGAFGTDELAGLATRINELLAALHSQHQLEQALTAAQDATRAKSVFLANMSHELRTPLNAIIGYSELLIDEAVDRGTADEFKDLKRIVAAGNHLQNIIRDVLDLAKIEAGKVDLNYAPLSLRSALNMVHDIIQLRAREKSLSLAFEVPGEIPDDFTGDVQRLQQILLNLLNNAVKYTERGHVNLLLSARKLSDFAAACTNDDYFEIQFAVSDSGIGIPENQLDTLFKPFNRVDSPTNHRLGGTGLGLALSKQLCELMSGRMWAHSRENEGSTFTFTIILKNGIEAVA